MMKIVFALKKLSGNQVIDYSKAFDCVDQNKLENS